MKTSQLLARDPSLKGKDRPTTPPSETFSAATKRKETREETITRLLSLLDDDSTIDDW